MRTISQSSLEPGLSQPQIALSLYARTPASVISGVTSISFAGAPAFWADSASDRAGDAISRLCGVNDIIPAKVVYFLHPAVNRYGRLDSDLRWKHLLRLGSWVIKLGRREAA